MLTPDDLVRLTGAPVADVVVSRMTQPDVGTLPSPCINVCRMDAATGLCEGCLRTLDEIALWSVLDDEDKRAVWRPRWRERRARLPPVAPMSPAGPHEAHRLPLRRRLAVRLPGLRAPAAGAARAAATRSNTGRCCLPACCSTGGTRARPRSSPSAPGPSARCTGWRSSTASRCDTPARAPVQPAGAAAPGAGLRAQPAHRRGRLPPRLASAAHDADRPAAPGRTGGAAGAGARPGRRRGQGRIARA